MKPDCFLQEVIFGPYNECVYTFGCKVSGSYYSPKKITAENKIFFSVIQIKDGLLYHWVHFCGSPIEAKKYSYTLEYYNDTKTPKVTCTFTDQVVSIDETADSIIENGNCFTIFRKAFENKFLLKDDKFKFSVKIRNLKEEVKDENVESGVSDVDE